MAHLKHSGPIRQAAHAKRTALVEILSDEPAANDAGAVEFEIGGRRYSLERMLDANDVDPDCCDWLRSARPGDVYEQMHAERAQCVAAGPRPFEAEVRS